MALSNVPSTKRSERNSARITSKHRTRHQWETDNANFVHGFVKSRTYNSWKAMKQRCTNPKDPSWEHYGARGITFCKRWQHFQAFLEDMGERPEGRSLDRVDSSKGYSAENCRWSTDEVQQTNKPDVVYKDEALLEAQKMRAAGASYRDIDRHFGTSFGAAWYALKYRRGL